MSLTEQQKRDFRSRGHHLKPVVIVADRGLDDAVMSEIRAALEHHELIKVRAAGGDRKARESLLAQICDRLDAAPVQHIGRMLVIFRPAPEQPEPLPKGRASKKSPRTKRDFQSD